MRFIVSCLLLTTSLILPAHLAKAESSGTIIINSDGTYSESGAEADNPLARHDAARAAVIKAEKIQPPEKADPAPIQNLEPEPEPVQKAPVQKPAAKKPVVKKLEKPAPVEAKGPEAKPVKAVAPKMAKPKKIAKAEKTETEQSPKIKWNKPPKKRHKPVAVEAPSMDVAPSAPVHPLTRDQALRAAIQVAPPFRSSRVVPEEFKGRHAFRVMLQTEDGQVDILVDGVTGDILKE